MIKSWRHRGLQKFFATGAKAGIQPHHAPRLARQLSALDSASVPASMDVPGWRLHRLSNGQWSVSVNGNWRMIFAFEGEDAILVDYQDYH